MYGWFGVYFGRRFGPRGIEILMRIFQCVCVIGILLVDEINNCVFFGGEIFLNGFWFGFGF